MTGSGLVEQKQHQQHKTRKAPHIYPIQFNDPQLNNENLKTKKSKRVPPLVFCIVVVDVIVVMVGVL
ncbi:hypothetical protein K457DRAFT_136085 [Linnemannia elongata AG-77]|uniref:Transmembrane protein n=1 Tax=Linnemannia elongata AG-77 TaxID=1314771 RepID=A0A197K257_9FUNG|nr:hypothetical protein K457DRAFT_136085 [Linnemannia elongata AG-77]